MKRNRAIVTIVIAQLFGTSVWFSPNAVGTQLMAEWGEPIQTVGTLTIAIQLGFVTGTLVFSVTGLADRYRASQIFFWCALASAATNASFALVANNLGQGVFWRALTGFCLAGVYPLGMKLVVSWWPERSGEMLGWLVGMLVLGTASPHLFRALGSTWDWQWVVVAASGLSVLAGVLIRLTGEGEHLPRTGVARLHLGALGPALRVPAYRGAVLGYLGHMWELYAAWTIVPLLIPLLLPGLLASQVSWLAFLTIGAGALGCVLGGRLSRTWGSARVAFVALATSGLVSMILPVLGHAPAATIIVALVVWGMALAADSPQFSSLSATVCPPQLVGSALAMANSLGFALTTLTIGLATANFTALGLQATWLLVLGPAVGLAAMAMLLREYLVGARRG